MEVIVTYESRCLAGILLVVLPTVMFGGASILSLLVGDPTYMQNPLRQDLWRAGHAHAGVWLILALVALRYVDEANLSNALKWLVRGSIPIAAILVPAAFFLSVLSPDAKAPNGLIYLAYAGAVVLALGVLVLGIGLVRRPAQNVLNSCTINEIGCGAAASIRSDIIKTVHGRDRRRPQARCDRLRPSRRSATIAARASA
jgi:hypothetical protein